MEISIIAQQGVSSFQGSLFLSSPTFHSSPRLGATVAPAPSRAADTLPLVDGFPHYVPAGSAGCARSLLQLRGRPGGRANVFHRRCYFCMNACWRLAGNCLAEDADFAFQFPSSSPLSFPLSLKIFLPLKAPPPTGLKPRTASRKTRALVCGCCLLRSRSLDPVSPRSLLLSSAQIQILSAPFQ